MRVTLLWMFFLLAQLTFAQEKTVSGLVSDESGGLPGVSVIIKGTTKGVETDFDGNYTIKTNQNDILVFSFVGKKTVQRTVGNSNKINVTMSDDDNVLNEIVVTALGVSREKQSLGYAVETVKGDEITNVKTTNVTNSLSGRVSGVNITSSSNMGGSSNIVIRGGSSLTGNNQALYVVDGVPISNATVNGGETNRGAGGYDYGNLASDINPEDIESISILKGASATALYGSRGANGVILVTTKKGKSSKGLGVTVSSSLTIDKINESTLPNYQNQYGGGTDWSHSISEFNEATINGVTYKVPVFSEDLSWGPKFDPNVQVLHWDAFDPSDKENYLKTRPWVATKNGPEAFFKTGFLKVNNIALEGGSEKGNFRVSYTNTDQEGTIPNSELQKNTISFNGSLNLNDRLSTSVNFQYINTYAKNRPGTGYDSAESLSFMASAGMWMHTNVDYDRLKNYVNNETGEQKTWNRTAWDDPTPSFWNNPYWTVYKNAPEDRRNRVVGNWTLNYKLNDWLSALGRASMDHYDFTIEEKIAIGSYGTSRYDKAIRTGTERNFELMLNFNKNVTDKLNITGLIGIAKRINKNTRLSFGTRGGLVIDGLYSIWNSKSAEIRKVDTESKRVTNSTFGTVSFGYDNMLYLDLSARNDWSSTLPSSNNSFFYPSISTSFIFSKVLNADFLNFGKIRANWAQVGNDAGFSVLEDTYRNAGNFGDVVRYDTRATKNNNLLVPEKLISYELGLDLKMFDNRLGIDFSYYNKRSQDLIIDGTISYGTGYSRQFLNSGEKEDKGFEVGVQVTPIKTENFRWDSAINWSTNKSTVLSLAPGINSLTLNSNHVAVVARTGQPYGLLVGTDYIYDDNGNKEIGTDGLYKRSDDNQVLGDINPDWRGGFSNSFSYKGFKLNTLIDVKMGGDLFSLTHRWGRYTGILEETTGVNNDNIDIRLPIADGGGLILPGVKEDGSANDQRVSAFNAFNADNNPEGASIFDASYVKLREVSLSYSFPQRLISKMNLTNLTISVIGRNLAILHRNIDHIDPEATYGSGNLQGLDIGTLPTTRSFGFSTKIGF